MQIASNDPLKHPKKADQNESTLKGLKSEISKPGYFVDPLNVKKANPLAAVQQKKLDPLSKAANFSAAKNELSENPDDIKKNFEIHKTTGDTNLAVKDKIVEFKNAEKKKETGLWSAIRSDFVKIFDLRNMEHFINNVIISFKCLIFYLSKPFGNIVMHDDSKKFIKENLK